jgi:hypothetical protein
MTTTYFQDIKPLFRPQDIACMGPRSVKLDDVTWMCDPTGGHGFDDHANARRVFAALHRGIMPPDDKWSPDWLDTFQSWMTDGFQPGEQPDQQPEEA